jgi:GPH family glycoside/pentoside/hexuronide:cation symporter
MNDPRHDARAPLSLAIAWGSGSFCQTLVIYAFGVLIFRYLTDTVGIAAALAGTLIGASKLYDALINPAIGWLTDRVETPMGRRRPWMLLGGIAMATALVVGFNVPTTAPMTLRIWWAAAGLFLFSTGYSFFAIPWLAMPPEISGDRYQRTQMMAWRVSFSSVAQGASSLTGPVLLSALGAGAFAYGIMGWTMGGVCLIAALSTVYLTRNAPQRAVERAERPAFLAQLRLMAENRPFVVMVLVKMFLYFGLAFNSGAMALLTRWVLHISDYWLGAFTLVSTLAALFSQPLWLWLDRRYGKRGALGICFAFHGLAQLSLYFNTGSPILLVVQGLFLGAGGGGVFMLSQSLLPEVIAHDYQRTGLRRGGAFAGVIALLETGAAAAALFVMGFVLSGAGYVQGLGAGGAQPASALGAIRVVAAILPTIAEIIAILFLTQYRLDADNRRAEKARA